MRFQGYVGASDLRLLRSVQHHPHLIRKLNYRIIFMACRGVSEPFGKDGTTRTELREQNHV